MAKSRVPESVAELVDPVVRERGLELVDVEFRPLGRNSKLILYLDRPGGVSLDDLATVSREVSDLLDVHDAVPGIYTLECSSPGINRPLRRREDFARFLGKVVKIRTNQPIEGSRNFHGTLAATSADGIEIDEKTHGRVAVPFGVIERANYEHDFSEDFHGGRS
jgi:ribosome maturation factor RimP